MLKRLPLASLLVAACLCLLFCPALLAAKDSAGKPSAPDQSCISPGWPHESSDLPADPEILFGTLDNGLRYIIRHNGKPRNRVAMFLNVRAGSLHESESQRGLAHYLEHMLFNGSTHYPPGTLVKYFQSIGMDFGADTNAHTSYDETVYTLVLPSPDEKTLSEGLTVLADFARGALLPEKEVDRERGVIFAEKRSRDTARNRVRKAQLAFDFAGSLVAERDPIGTDATLKQADAARLRAFYDNWYRPDNLAVVIVGDIDRQVAEKLVRQHFSGLDQARDSAPQCPQYGEPESSALRVHFLAEPELGHTEISLASVRKMPPEPATQARAKAELHQYLATILLNNRLNQLKREKDSPITQNMAFSGNFIPQFRYSLMELHTEADKWEESLRLLTGTLEQALRDGFTAGELERGKKEVLAKLEEAVQTADSRDSRELAMDLVHNLNQGEVSQSPAQEKALFAPLVERCALEEVNQALRELWPAVPRTVSVLGTALPGLPPAQAKSRILARYAEALAAKSKPWQEMTRPVFPYLPVPEQAQEPIQEQTASDIGTQTLVFAGGVTAHLKKTDFQPNQVLISAHFGGGTQDEPAFGAALLAQKVVQESGTATLTREQVEEALAGSTVTLEFNAGPESFFWSGSALNSELEALMQLLHACLHDPGFRPDAFGRVKEQLKQRYAALSRSVEGVQHLEGTRFLSGGSRFYTLPSWQEVEALSLPALESWLRPLILNAPLEINLVGDLDMVRTRQLLGRYFGAEKREAGGTPEVAKSPLFPQGQSKVLKAPDSSGKALVTLAWKTDDFWEIQRTRGLNLLARVLEDRLRLKIREELGEAYSPRVISRPSKTDPGFGLLEGLLIVSADKADQLAQAARGVVAALVREGVSAEEFKRAQEPTLTAIREQLRNNDYWLNTVLSLSNRHPEQLRWPATIVEDFSAMQPKDLDRLAKTYLDPDRAATVLVLPER